MIIIDNNLLMLADSDIEFKIEKEQRKQAALKDIYLKNINKMKEEEKDEFDLNSQRISILNQELDILRLEFEIEEAAPSSK